MIKCLIFDLDETLVNRWATMELFLKEQHSRFDLDSLIDKDTFARENLIAQNNGYTEKTVAYRKVCEAYSLDLGLPEKLYDDYINNYGQNAVAMKGALKLLESLQDKYTLAMVTNGKTSCQNKKIDSLGIRKYFKTIKISQTEGIAKPDLRIFDLCLKDLGLDARECAFIGDHPVNDIASARKVGMKGIWVKNDRYEVKENFDAVLTNLSDLEEILESLTLSLK